MPDQNTKDKQAHSTRESVGEEGEISLLDIARFFRRQWYLMVVPAILVGAAYRFFDARQRTPMYEARATLLIVPPKVSSEIRPAKLSVQGYQRLLGSDELIERTRSWLAKGRDELIATIQEEASRKAEISKVVPAKQTFPGQDALNISGMLRSEVVPGDQGDTFAPMLEAICTASDPELAATVVNVWALAFKSHTRDLMLGTFSDAVKYVEDAYPKTKKGLEELEAKYAKWTAEQELVYGKQVQAWMEKVAEFREKTRSALSTRRRAELLRKLKQDRKVCEERLKQTPGFLVSRRGPPDEALWREMDKGTSVDLEKLHLRYVLEQQPNPAHIELRNELIRLDAELEIWGVDRKEGTDEPVSLPAVNAAMAAFELEDPEPLFGADVKAASQSTLFGGEAPRRVWSGTGEARRVWSGTDEARDEQEQGLALIDEKMRTDWETLAAVRSGELARMRRAIRQEADKYEQELKVLNESDSKLTSLHNQIELSKAQQDIEDVRIGSYAVPPRSSIPEPTSRKYLVPALLAGMLGFLIALLREAK